MQQSYTGLRKPFSGSRFVIPNCPGNAELVAQSKPAAALPGYQAFRNTKGMFSFLQCDLGYKSGPVEPGAVIGSRFRNLHSKNPV
ncbi:hypothetical protein D3C81_1551930 [compost metagenome]